MTADTARAQGGRVWDPLVRLTHWTIAFAVVLNGLIVEGGAQLHIWIGYAMIAMLGLRLLWGLVGPEEARFTAFPPSLRAAWSHIADIRAGRHEEHRSHNPLGALMAYAMWATLIVMGVTGLAMESDPFPEGRTYGYVEPETGDEAQGAEEHEEDGEDEEGEDVLEEIHEFGGNLLLVLAALHLAGVAFESRRGGRNLVRGMIGPGRR
ncbi:cytochrome b/b6 domain-containing protein [Psychromarinibacter sp. C21-152]|uniref:Cytochrome b/b6 domain-containing protein n=1 Tax=Psychromarinibacter sediminicola TaxID=3033385 RepID=A0AAE3T8B1_9RHOB|nr:cytochrome b/b6 domain-containing protein [Psychromarinibacter sediminicola]MDF0601087.1 cytochrome b/b6 domain-containing protein [Psychromarinibacter sediminicola]